MNQELQYTITIPV